MFRVKDSCHVPIRGKARRLKRWCFVFGGFSLGIGFYETLGLFIGYMEKGESVWS